MAKPTQKICLFGGTFDPIHLGHIHIAKAAVKQLDLNRVLFLPCRQSPHKTGQQHAGATHRLEMCRLATAGLAWAEVNDYELTAPTPSYSWRTATEMTARFPRAQLFWLMGSDQWQSLPLWNRPNYLAEFVEFIVYSRGNIPTPRAGYRMHAIHGDHPASATQIRESASTGLRKDWLTPNVASYITDKHLYQRSSPNGNKDPQAGG